MFDLGPYLGYLNEEGEDTSAVLKVFRDAVAEIGENGDAGRRARILINMTKMRSMLGFVNEFDQIKELELMYKEFVELDGKPEKGERKLADDMILVLNENINELPEASADLV